MKSMKAAMKAISPLIGTVIIISIVVVSIGAILLVANPEINRAKAGMSINEAKQNMKIIDDTIRQVASEGTGALRSLTLKTSDGTFVVRNSTGIEYILDSDFNYVPVRAVIKDGNMRMSSGMSALGLVGYWRFDEGGGAVANDSSGYGNDGTVYVYNQSMANWTTGKFGNALQFDGIDDYVSVPSSASLNLQKFTISAWVFTHNSISLAEVVRKQSGASTNYYLLTENNKFEVAYTSSTNWNLTQGTTTPTADIWYHVIGVFDGSSQIIYVNGVQENISSANTMPDTNSGNVVIGGTPLGNRPWNGTIDEVKIYNRALNATEVQDDYNLPPNKLKISLDYDNIIIKGTSRWGKGTTKICIEKLGAQSNKALVEVRTC